MENETVGHKIKRKTKRVFRIFLLVLLLISAGVFSFYYWATYEEGVMSGKILRVSQKGVVFKTYEGKINLETFGALKGVSPIAESFDFSIEKSDTALINQLQQVSLTGERINLHFKKRYAAFPWRGDTKYFATKADRIK